MGKKITLAVSGKFHAFHLAKEYAKLNLLDSIHCISKEMNPPKGVSKKQYYNNITLGVWKLSSSYLNLLGYSPEKKNLIFDDLIAKRIKNIDSGILHTWNGASLKTLKVASKFGWKTCLERSCPENMFQHDLLLEESDILGLPYKGAIGDALKRNIEELYLADKIICPSTYSANSYKDPELIKKLIISNLGNNYAYHNRKIKDKKVLRILMVGNTFLRKGTHYLIESLKYIDHPNIELWIRGSVPIEYRKNIKDKRVKIIDTIPFEQLQSLYMNADVYVQSSIDEGFGMTVLEALSYGLPIVYTDNVGAGDTLNSKVGIKVPIRNSELLAVAIMKAPSLVDSNFDDERLAILNRFSWNRCALDLINSGYK
jgi:glycosyltransferase involved in cell wall biosynthesis